MNKILVFSIIMFLACFVSVKNNDLILTTDGDSIACEIIEVNDSEIILKMRYDSRNVQTTISRDETSKYEYDVIQEDMYRNKTDTCDNKMYPISSKTYSLENLQNASTEELEYYQFKAEKQKNRRCYIRHWSWFNCIRFCIKKCCRERFSHWKK